MCRSSSYIMARIASITAPATCPATKWSGAVRRRRDDLKAAAVIESTSNGAGGHHSMRFVMIFLSVGQCSSAHAPPCVPVHCRPSVYMIFLSDMRGIEIRQFPPFPFNWAVYVAEGVGWSRKSRDGFRAGCGMCGMDSGTQGMRTPFELCPQGAKIENRP